MGTSATIELKELVGAKDAAVRVGRIVRISDEGRAFVDYPGNPGTPVVARCVVGAIPSERTLAPSDAVLLVFESGLPASPIIVGVVQEEVRAARSERGIGAASPLPRDISLDGKRLVLEANEEICLRCGKGSITLTSDGRVLIKGTHLVNRSSGRQVIKGAVVQIN